MPNAPRLGAFAALALAAALVASPGCSGGDEGEPTTTYTATATAEPTATPTPSPAATPTPSPEPPITTPTAAPGAEAAPAGGGGLLPPELGDEMIGLLLDAMRDPDSELFSGAIDALPPLVRTVLDVLGVDLLLGVVVADTGAGAGVAAALPGSPAARAGLAEGDLITAIDSTPVTSGAELRAAIEALAAGEAYVLTVERGGAPGLLDIEREAASEGDAWRAELLRLIALAVLLGGGPDGPDLPPSLLGELVEETPDGLRVFAVFPGSPADAGGILPGDLLVSIDGRQLATIADLDALMRSGAPPIGPIEVAVIRDGAELTLEIDLAAGGMFGGGLPAQ